MTAVSVQSAGTFEVLPIGELSESPWNPRKHFDQAKLQELASSIRELGVLTPLLARPRAGGKNLTYELAAGHRRFRAAQIAGIAEVPVIIRDMDDVQFLEVLTIENLQRDDVHPLEEAQGYADLIKEAAYDAQRIADRVGKSLKYVYDRIKLLQLIPEARKLFLANRITAGHAILLARLKKADQERALDPEGAEFGGNMKSGLWTREITLFDPELEDRKPGKYEGLKTVSVRELETWIDRHVRLDLEHDVEPILFPEIAAKVVPAIEEERKVLPITYDHMVAFDAKDDDGGRTYGAASWERADGKRESKTCEYSLLGAVVAGRDRGQAFLVCVNKHKCDVHWPAEAKAFRAREKAKKEADKNGGKVSAKTASKVAKADTVAAAAEARAKEERKAAEVEAKRVKAATPELVKRFAAHVKVLPVGRKSAIGKYLLDHLDQMYINRDDEKRAEKYFPGASAEDLVRYVVFADLSGILDDEHRDLDDKIGDLKAIGFDLEKHLEEISPKPTPEKKPAAKSAKKAGRGR